MSFQSLQSTIDPETKNISDNTAELIVSIDKLNENIKKMDASSGRYSSASLVLSLTMMFVALVQIIVAVYALQISFFVRLIIVVLVVTGIIFIVKFASKEFFKK